MGISLANFFFLNLFLLMLTLLISCTPMTQLPHEFVGSDVNENYVVVKYGFHHLPSVYSDSEIEKIHQTLAAILAQNITKYDCGDDPEPFLDYIQKVFFEIYPYFNTILELECIA